MFLIVRKHRLLARDACVSCSSLGLGSLLTLDEVVAAIERGSPEALALVVDIEVLGNEEILNGLVVNLVELLLRRTCDHTLDTGDSLLCVVEVALANRSVDGDALSVVGSAMP